MCVRYNNDLVYINAYQGFSLVSALGHSPKNKPDVRDTDDQAGHFVREHSNIVLTRTALVVGNLFIL